MSLRPPQILTPKQVAGLGRSNTLEYEILAEQAAALGNAGHEVERTLKVLLTNPPDSPDHEACLKNAARAVHHYFIQRELIGFKSHDDAIALYQIPSAVLARVGAS